MKVNIIITLFLVVIISRGPSGGKFKSKKNERGGEEGRTRRLFSGEDLLKGAPWWHQKMTEEACYQLGFTNASSELVAWHADYVDSYAYNPLYWFDASGGGGLGRFKVAQSIHQDLVKVHDDDCSTNKEVITTAYRYMTGCLVGL